MPLRLSLAVLLAGALIACGADADRSLVTIVFMADGNRVELRVEIADSPAERARGLKFRESLPEDRGMLFDFGGETTAGFWMKDTSIPLSIAFVSAEGVVLGIQDMEPFSEELHRSDRPYAFAVEANQGRFERQGIEAGDTVDLPPRRRMTAPGSS